ncbi:MAG: hypothetical protein JXD21_02190 [Candidatus Omnitrophica bacterium]|nr:hypothetical protein [Candidatus Omnitrophota bacterium]
MSHIDPLKNSQVHGVGKVTPQAPAKGVSKGSSFKEVLESKLDHEITFSGHALERIQRREIKFDETRLNKLKTAVEMADKKGARSSLVLMEDLALIVSIKNRTVITAIDGRNVKENVFTNIDSAIIV